MNKRHTTILAALLLSAAAGCAGPGLDPLLYDETGQTRTSVGADEVDEAGITDRCDALADDLEAAVDTTRVPVEGGDEPVVLVGVGGMALCLDDDGGEPGDEGGEEDGDLPSYEPTGQVGVGGGLEVDEEGDVPGVTHRTLTDQGPPPPKLIEDPTPQPIKE